MTVSLVVVGAGGHGRESVDIIRAINREQHDRFALLGVLDSSPTDKQLLRLASHSITFLGDEDTWLTNTATSEIRYVIGISNPSAKERIDSKFSAFGLLPQTLIHPKAWIGGNCKLGPGTVVWPGASLTVDVSTGRHVSVNNNVTIGHDSEIEDYVSIHPNASISGDVLVEKGVLVGSNATILQGRTLGSNSVIGAATCVTKNIPPNKTMIGVPARELE